MYTHIFVEWEIFFTLNKNLDMKVFVFILFFFSVLKDFYIDVFTRVVHKLPGKEILKLWCCIKLFYLTEFVIYGSWFYMGWWEYISCAVIWTKWCNILYSGLFFALLHLQFISFHLKFDQNGCVSIYKHFKRKIHPV